MSRRLTRISLTLVLLLSGEVWAIGLGDIQLDSALNEPLRAEIELLSATPEELANLSVKLASAETFARYGIDRPYYLQGIAFNVQAGPSGAVIQVRSASPITEPFLTFLVEATWSAGRLLREYTVLLDPPTYSPPAVQQAPAVQAPRRAAPTDSARIERQPPQQPQPVYRPPTRPAETTPARPAETPAPRQPVATADDPAYRAPYSTTTGGDYYVERGDTLWGITSRLRPDSRLSINQTMVAIFEANPQAFEGNINRLKANVTLRIPSADDVFQISRGDALVAVKRMNDEWRGTTAPAATAAATGLDEPAADVDTGYGTGVAEPAQPETETSLTLVPPDEEPAGVDFEDELDAADTTTREQQIADRIAELEAADVPNQQSLIEIRDNELAALRQELAEIRGEVYEPPVMDVEPVADDALAGDEIQAETADEIATEDAAAEEEAAPTSVVTTRVSEPGLMDSFMGILGSWWLKVGAAIILAAGVLLWFVRRGRGDDDDDSWETLDSAEIAAGAMSATETLAAPSPDESFVVVEQDSGIHPVVDEATVETPAPAMAPAAETGQFDSLEDTFSSDTAVNLDQTDPLAEADFHMAYGLYDQAADLVNGALQSEPNDKALMSKLCEIYFVWGNRDAFIDAASNLKNVVGDGDTAEWDKIVIMGQQIAADHALFAGAGVAGATKAVDLSFEAEMDEAAALDMDFGGDEAGASDIVDLGAPESDDGDGLDFLFDGDATTEAATEEMTREEPTAEMPSPSERTVESPTIEEQFAGLEATSELPSLDESVDSAIAASGRASDETAEINLDELGLDIGDLDETELASFDDLDATGTNEVLEDTAAVTGKNPEIDPDATGVQQSLDPDADDLQDVFDVDSTSMNAAFDLDEAGETGIRLAPDETGRMPALDALEETDTSIDSDLLDATGKTQVLSEDLAVDTGFDMDSALGDDEATLLASLDEDEDTEVSADAETLLASLDDDDDFDFAKTEALPQDAFTTDAQADETGEMPAVAGTDVDLDLDDLTAALQVSGGDTVEQPRDDATVEQPRPSVGEATAEVPTMEIGPDDISDDLHEARTMTEVGTKLDLARAYVDMGDPAGARSILEEVLDEGDEGQRQQAQQLLDSLPG